MKTVTGRLISVEPVLLSSASKILSGFVSSENGASQDVSAYLRRASAAFSELKSFHREIKPASSKERKPRSNVRENRNLTGELKELCLANGIDDLVRKGRKIRLQKSETVSEEVSIYGREQNERKEGKKKKSKKNKEDNVVDEKEKEKLEVERKNEDIKEKKWKSGGEMGSEERISKKIRKSKEIDV